MIEKIYPKGLRTFPARENAPEFVKGTLIVTLEDLNNFAKESSQYLTEFDGKKQLKLNILSGDKGLYFTVDTWKPNTEATPKKQYTGFSEIQNDIKRTNTVKENEIEYSEDINPDDIPF